jgi:ZIP family zinc transporter
MFRETKSFQERYGFNGQSFSTNSALPVISLAAAVVGPVLRGTGPAVRGTVEAFAAGVILALVSETMIPEAFHGSPQFNGLLLVVGFVALLILLVLSH